MFIPIDARADITEGEGAKKGKLTPAQHAQLNAWCLASKTGILNIYNNTTQKYERCEAENSTYTATNNIVTVVFKKGFVVICGRLVECEQGTEVTVSTPSTGTANGKIILKYNLAGTGSQEFVVTTKTGELIQQDLNDNPLTGVYEFELYRYVATPTTVTLTRSNTNYIPDIGGKLQQFENSLKDEGKPLHGYDDSKGTIEERLTKLGFREGSVTLSSGTATENKIVRQGNYCILNLVADVNIKIPALPVVGTWAFDVATIHEIFIPKEKVSFYGAFDVKGYTGEPLHSFQVSIDEQGKVVAIVPNGSYSDFIVKKIMLKCVGYDKVAQPITTEGE